MTTLAVEHELRGAPWDLLKRLANYREQKRVLEVLIEGPGGTGKSRGIGHVLFWLGFKFPGIRMLVVRKTRKSLTESFLQTWEDDCVPEGHALLQGPTRAHRDEYDFGNGSKMILGGMDNPTRLYSTSFDVVYVQEAVELTLDEWERFYRALRAWTPPMKFQLLLGDTNPDARTHWLNKRCDEGKCERMRSRHEDNPKWHDGKTWTFEGLAYIGGLQRLSGVRRARLLEGRWDTAEGAVWETFDANMHCIDRPKSLKIELGITWFVGAMDWGYSDPGVLQVWGITPDKRAYRVAEWYTREELQAWWVAHAVEAAEQFQPMRRIVCDPSRIDAIEAINKRFNELGLPSIACGANNARHSGGQGDLVGLDLVREKLAGPNPSLYFLRDSLMTRDEWLIQNSLPICTEQEIPGYVFLLNEDGKAGHERTDPACPDHGCDATRYMANYIWRRDLSPAEEAPRPVVGTRASALARRDPDAAQEWVEVENYKLKKAARRN